MPQTFRATFKALAWDEVPVTEDGVVPRLTRASCRQEYSGEIVGESTLEYVMVHHPDDRATFVGLENIVGSVGDRRGSFALRHRGVFEDGVARMTLEVVDGAGTGELKDMSGGGEFESAHAAEYTVDLTLSFEGDGVRPRT